MAPLKQHAVGGEPRRVAVGFMGSREKVLNAIYVMGCACCSYSHAEKWADFCDCKYGIVAGSWPTIHEGGNGCPELRSLHGAIAAMTDEEWALLTQRAGGVPSGLFVASPEDIRSKLHRADAARMAAENIALVRSHLSLEPSAGAFSPAAQATGEAMSDAQLMLRQFHAALGDESGRGNAQLRITLHGEEHAELIEALYALHYSRAFGRAGRTQDRGRREALARELADVVYVAYGTAHAFGIDLDAALLEVHRAAMSKLDPATMVVREAGKVLKPEGFVPPDMSRAIGGEA
jgi:NTP pyrophosphatase (non-canonical NTP hydrolase)